MAAKIEEEADKLPDAILTTISKPSVVGPAIQYASQKVPVFTFNSGYDVAKDFGAMAHVGMHEYNGGRFALDSGFDGLATARGKTITACLYLTQFRGSANIARRAGFKAACEARGLQFLYPDDSNCQADEGCVLNVVSVDTAVDEVNRIYNSLNLGTNAIALLCASTLAATPALRAFESNQNVLIGTFDYSTSMLEKLSAGELGFAISQNSWLQGYLPALLAATYAGTGQLMSPEVYMTGPSYITEAPSDDYAIKAGEAFPICDCPWSPDGNEAKVDCSESEAIGPCPATNGACSVACFDARGVKIAGITHGREDDSFWFVVKAGAEQAARDLRLTGFEMDLWKHSEYSESNMAQRIRSTSQSGKYQGIFATVPGATAEAAIADAVSAGVFVATVNSGDAVSQSLGAVAHIGMPEKYAGNETAKQLQVLGASKILCLIHERGNAGLDARCAGAAEFAASAGNLTIITANMVNDGVDTTSEDQIRDYVVNKLSGDTSIDGLMFCGSSIAEVFVDNADLEPFGSAPRNLVAGSFDNSIKLQDGIDNKAVTRIFFGISQQQYMQGYMGVLYLWLYIVTGQKLATHMVGTGPSCDSTSKCRRRPRKPLACLLSGSSMWTPACRSWLVMPQKQSSAMQTSGAYRKIRSLQLAFQFASTTRGRPAGLEPVPPSSTASHIVFHVPLERTKTIPSRRPASLAQPALTPTRQV
eukprot:TRINITY_DN26743_c0_g1_i1.p1 TRINITY_DN26743_c0_g1~~TRINITY_DN26743_c0_g1_i1.p1  ORF type:complete len:806 (+),score=120.17 TRINITY_DN26743_c0_g1_i1:308-2419(+)